MGSIPPGTERKGARSNRLIKIVRSIYSLIRQAHDWGVREWNDRDGR